MTNDSLIQKLIEASSNCLDSRYQAILLDEAIDIIRQYNHDQLPHPFTEAIKAYPELFPGGNDTSGQGALTDSLCDMYLSKITDENNPIDLTPQRLKRMESAFRLAIGSWYEEQAPSQEIMRLPLDEAKAIYEHYNKGAVVDYSNGATLTDADLRRKTRELPSEISSLMDIAENHISSDWMPPTLKTIGRWKQHEAISRRDWVNVLTLLERSMKPVSVSLERCSQAVYSEINYGANNYESIAKSVLDIVGVPYHE